MNKIIENFMSPEWWVTVFLFGIIVSLVGNYSKIMFDKLYVKLSRTRRLKKEKEFEELIRKADIHPKGEFDLITLNFQSTKNYIRGMHLNIISGIFVVFALILYSQNYFIPEIIVGIFALFIGFEGIKLINKSYKQTSLFNYIYKKNREERINDT